MKQERETKSYWASLRDFSLFQGHGEAGVAWQNHHQRDWHQWNLPSGHKSLALADHWRVGQMYVKANRLLFWGVDERNIIVVTILAIWVLNDLLDERTWKKSKMQGIFPVIVGRWISVSNQRSVEGIPLCILIESVFGIAWCLGGRHRALPEDCHSPGEEAQQPSSVTNAYA